MSRLDELIQKLCPDGVEYFPLKQVCSDFIVPMRDRPKVFDGEIPWCRIEDKEGQYFHKSLSGLAVSEAVIKKMNLKVFPMGTVICSCSASIGAYAINTQPLITNQTFIGLVCGKRLFNKYLLYFMETQTENLLQLATTGTIPYISRKKFETLVIPVPPLPVQEEIVRILDSFTQLTAELQAELQARKRQYEYYHNNLMDFSNRDIEYKSVGELFDIKNGLNKGKDAFGKGQPIINFTDVYNKRWLANGSFKGLVDVTEDEIERYSAKKGDVFFTRTSETKEDIGMSSTLIEDVPNCVFSGFVLRARPTTDLLFPKFCSYYFSCNKVRDTIVRYAAFTTRATTTGPKLSKIMVPILPMEEQERIVSILDSFQSLTENISAGLPAEIKARQKQYEYYRDKLLTFKELA